MKSLKFVLSCFFVVPVLSFVGCASSEPVPPADVTPVSQSGNAYYSNAKSAWPEVYGAPRTRREMEIAIDEIVVQLQRALDNDPRCLLFMTKIADLHLDKGDLGPAEGYYRQAYRLSADWTPAWIGLARIALMQGDHQQALMLLDGAKLSMESQERWGQQPARPFLSFVTGILGIDLLPPSLARDLGDPTLSAEDARSLVQGWLEEHLSWRVDARGLEGRDEGVSPGGGIFRRLMARIVFYRGQAELLSSGNTTTGGLIAICDEALRFDPDLLMARLMQAEAHFSQAIRGNRDALRRAHSLLEPYVATQDPMLVHHDLISGTLGKVFVLAYLEQPGARQRNNASQYLAYLRRVQGGYPDGTIWRIAASYLLIEKADRATLEDALREALRWRVPDFPVGIARVRDLLVADIRAALSRWES